MNKSITNISVSLLGTALLSSCVNYPKNYTYSPTVTINGSGAQQSPVILPNPFATNKSESKYVVNYTPSPNYSQQPSPLTARIERPPVSAQYYYDDEDSYVQSNFEQPVEEMTLEAY